MDTTLAATVVTEMTGFSGDLLTQFGAILPVAIGFMVSVAAVRWTINHFRSMVKA